MPSFVGVANLVTFPDGLTGGAHIAALGGPLLLTAQQTLSPEVEAYLTANAGTIALAYVYGGDAAIAPGVRDAIATAISPPRTHGPPASEATADRARQPSSGAVARAIAARTPLTKRGESSVDRDLASSTASSMATAGGTSGRCRSS